MLADDGTIQKRFGSHTVYNFSSHEAFADITPVVNGIYKLASKNYSAFIFHVANQLFVDDEMIDAPVNNAKSCGFVHNESLYLLTGAEYLRLWFSDSGQVQLESVTQNCYIPTTSIGRVGGSAPGGTTGEPANLLTGWRKNSFATDGVQDKFYLETPAKSKDGVKVELRNSAGVFETVPDTDYYFFNSGYVYFHEPPAATAVPGQDNLRVTYCTPTDGKARFAGVPLFAGMA